MQTKDVTVSGRKYRIEQMVPLMAGRVKGWLWSASIKFARDDRGQTAPAESRSLTPAELQELAEGSVKYAWSIAPSSISEEACEKIQRYALQQCKYFDASTQAPCDLLVGNTIADAALKDDGPGIDELIVHSLQFSVSPFFSKELAERLNPAAPKATVN